MNRDEIVMLLSHKAGFDSRPFDEADVYAWFEVLKEATYDDAREAVSRHFSVSEKRLYPVDVVKIIGSQRELRLKRQVDPIPDVDPDDVTGYLRALKENRRAIAEGRHDDVKALPEPDRHPEASRALNGAQIGAQS